MHIIKTRYLHCLLYTSPVGVFADEVLIIGNLVAQGVELFVLFTGHTGVVGNPHGNIIDRFCFELLPCGMYVHTGYLQKVRIIIIYIIL